LLQLRADDLEDALKAEATPSCCQGGALALRALLGPTPIVLRAIKYAESILANVCL
jgi:hypothetical protein